MMFIKLTPTPYQQASIETEYLWVNKKYIVSMAYYGTHTALHTTNGVYGVIEKPEEIFGLCGEEE